jgi:hypothetical protein
MKFLLSESSAAAMGIAPGQNALLSQKKVGQFGEMMDSLGITAIGNEPNVLIADISRSSPANVMAAVEALQASACILQPNDANCFIRGIEAASVADYIRQNKGADFLMCEPHEVVDTFTTLWKRSSPRPDFDERGHDASQTDDATELRKQHYGNVTASDLAELREWGASESDDEKYIMDQTNNVGTGL